MMGEIPTRQVTNLQWNLKIVRYGVVGLLQKQTGISRWVYLDRCIEAGLSRRVYRDTRESTRMYRGGFIQTGVHCIERSVQRRVYLDGFIERGVQRGMHISTTPLSNHLLQDTRVTLNPLSVSDSSDPPLLLTNPPLCPSILCYVSICLSVLQDLSVSVYELRFVMQFICTFVSLGLSVCFSMCLLLVCPSQSMFLRSVCLSVCLSICLYFF